jgi:hypothetical protein
MRGGCRCDDDDDDDDNGTVFLMLHEVRECSQGKRKKKNLRPMYCCVMCRTTAHCSTPDRHDTMKQKIEMKAYQRFLYTPIRVLVTRQVHQPIVENSKARGGGVGAMTMTLEQCS